MKKNVAIIGTGYVGLVTGTCLAEMGNKAICFDVNRDRIENLKKGAVPFYEPGLKKYAAIVIKSTVPPKTCRRIREVIKKYSNAPFDLVSNPEFLREGSAVL